MTTLTENGQRVGRPPKFDEQDITNGLVMIISCGGNVNEAHRRLTSKGGNVPSLSVLKTWKTAHVDRYRELERKHGPQLEDIAVDNARRAMVLAAQVEQKGLESVIDAQKKAGYRTGSQDALNASKIKAAQVDQILKLTGRPTEITEHRNADDVMDSLMRKLGIPIDEPITDATIIEPREITP